MYLSQVVLNPMSRQARRDVALPYQMHRTLSRVAAKGDGARPLWRLEPERQGRPPILLLQSPDAPYWSVLDPGYMATAPASRRLDLEAWDLSPGRVLRFRLRANPVKRPGKQRLAEGDCRPGQRLALVGEDACLAWLQRQGQHGGFRVRNALVVAEDDIRRNAMVKGYQRGPDDQRRPISLYSVRFDGLLEVDDAKALRRSIRQGIGPGKAFGFGLLSLASAT